MGSGEKVWKAEMFLAAPISGASLPSAITLNPEEIFARARRAGEPPQGGRGVVAGRGKSLPVPSYQVQRAGRIVSEGELFKQL